jgi:hypothetical protein
LPSVSTQAVAGSCEVSLSGYFFVMTCVDIVLQVSAKNHKCPDEQEARSVGPIVRLAPRPLPVRPVLPPAGPRAARLARPLHSANGRRHVCASDL